MKNELFEEIEYSNRLNEEIKTYETGSAVRQAEPAYAPEKAPHRVSPIREVPSIVPKPRVSRAVDFISMAILGTAILVTVVFCLKYLQLKADIIELEKSVSSISTDVSNFEKENDALEAEITSKSLDLENVYAVAVGSLGMVYPNKNEVVYYSCENTSYYRTYSGN